MRHFLNTRWFYNNQFKKRLFLSYILVLIPPLIVMGLLSYWWMGSILSHQVEKSYQSMIGSVRDNIDNRFNELYHFSLQLGQTQWVNKLMYMQGDSIDRSRVNNFDLAEYCSQLRGFDAVNEFINTLSIVLPEKKFIISSLGTADNELYFDEIRRLKSTDLLEWEGILDKLKTTRILPPDLLYSKDRIPQKVLTYVCPIPSLDDNNHATMITYIFEDTLTGLIEGIGSAQDSSVYILDEHNAVITGVNPQDKILSGLSLNSIDMGKGESSILNVQGSKYFIFSNISKVNNWRYLVAIPYRNVMEKVDYIKNVSIILAGLLCTIGLILAYGLTIRNYNPLSKLVETIRGHARQKYDIPDMDEFDFLRSSVLSILSEEDMLRDQFEKQKPIIRNAYLLKLLSGNIEEKEMTSGKLELMDIYFPYKFFCVVMFVFNPMRAVSESFQNRISEDGDRMGIINCFAELDGNKKALIMNYDDMQNTHDFIFGLKERTETELNVRCIIGVGKPCSSLTEIQNSCREAAIAVDYKLISDDNDIIFFENLESVNTKFYYYPIDKEIKILNELRTANYNGAMDVVREIVAFNTGNNNINIINAKCLFYGLAGTAFKALSSLNIAHLIDISQDQIGNLKTLVEMQNYLDGVYKKICDYISQNKKNQNELLKCNIKVFIDESYSNQDLSLEMLSNAMGISVSHLCKLFKEQFGYNFLDYLNRKRIEKAKELFNGHMTISQIARTVGYNNDITFRRVFKKYEGITPGKVSGNLYENKD